mgnify:CR=1 FL=1
MIENAMREITRYKRLPILTAYGWKCVFTTFGVLAVAIVMAG